MTMQRPVPVPTPETREYWDAAARGVLMFQVCTQCSHVQTYPRIFCTQCNSASLEMRQSSGCGTVFSFTVAHRAATPAFKADVPYCIVLVDVEEGFRVMANASADDAAQMRIGDRVNVIAADRGDGVILFKTVKA